MNDEISKMEQIAHDERVRSALRAGMGEHNPDAMVIADCDGIIRMVNQAAVRFFGWSREEMIGNEIEMLLPERFRDGHRNHRKVAWRDQRSRDMGNRTLTGITKDGEEFAADVMITWPEFQPYGIFAMAVLRKPREQ